MTKKKDAFKKYLNHLPKDRSTSLSFKDLKVEHLKICQLIEECESLLDDLKIKRFNYERELEFLSPGWIDNDPIINLPEDYWTWENDQQEIEWEITRKTSVNISRNLSSKIGWEDSIEVLKDHLKILIERRIIDCIPIQDLLDGFKKPCIISDNPVATVISLFDYWRAERHIEVKYQWAKQISSSFVYRDKKGITKCFKEQTLRNRQTAFGSNPSLFDYLP